MGNKELSKEEMKQRLKRREHVSREEAGMKRNCKDELKEAFDILQLAYEKLKKDR